jgi:hypothetical protein
MGRNLQDGAVCDVTEFLLCKKERRQEVGSFPRQGREALIKAVRLQRFLLLSGDSTG